MKILLKRNAKGFTLIEIIVTLTIAAIVGTVLFEYLWSTMANSSLPIGRLQTSFSCQQVMENLVAAYGKYYPGDLPGLQSSIGVEGSSPTNGYGQYTVVENHYIKFVSNQEQIGSPTDNLLKVTIKNSNNETLTNIFAQ